jgi:hypothetical protein
MSAGKSREGGDAVTTTKRSRWIQLVTVMREDLKVASYQLVSHVYAD